MIGLTLTGTILFSIQRLYVWLETDYSGKEEESTVKESPSRASRRQPQKSKLEPRIAKFISLVCNLSMMNQQMMKIGYNANKLPLGKLSKSTIFKGDPFYAHYQRLHCELVPVEFGTEEFSMIENYMKNTCAKKHSNYTVEIVQIFRASKEGEAERFRKFSNTKNRMLLWHGSRLTNWTGILSQGLRIAPPEANM
ncbi:Poly [ADP-ribose] polymerase 2 [Trifolium repens]|nr:Poly [ADP-ribose] polymerase 2 [Trifolium repens]